MKIATYMVLHLNHTFYWQQCRYVMVLSFEILCYLLCALRRLLKNFTGFRDYTLTLLETSDTCMHQKTWPSFFLYNDVLPTQHQAHIQTNASSLSIRSFSAYINEFNLNDNLKVAFAQWLPFGLGLSVLTSDQYPGIMPHMNPLHRYGFT